MRKNTWKEISKEEYMQKVVGMKVMESFSDPDGTLPFGNGYPCMETVWGENGENKLRCESRKESRHDLDWKYTYSELIGSIHDQPVTK